MIRRQGGYEHSEAVWREPTSAHCTTFVDVGANVGDRSNEVIEYRVGDGRRTKPARMRVVEPRRACFLQLRTRMEDVVARGRPTNVSITLKDLAVGKAAARADLSMVSLTGGANTIVPFNDAVGQSL